MAWLIGESSLWSMKVSDPLDLVDLAVRRFKHDGDLGDLRCLREPSELVGSHNQVGALGLIDIMAVNELARLPQTPKVARVIVVLKAMHCQVNEIR